MIPEGPNNLCPVYMDTLNKLACITKEYSKRAQYMILISNIHLILRPSSPLSMIKMKRRIIIYSPKASTWLTFLFRNICNLMTITQTKDQNLCQSTSWFFLKKNTQFLEQYFPLLLTLDQNKEAQGTLWTSDFWVHSSTWWKVEDNVYIKHIITTQRTLLFMA